MEIEVLIKASYNNGEDGVVAVASHGESGDEVHGDAFPRFGGDREWLE